MFWQFLHCFLIVRCQQVLQFTVFLPSLLSWCEKEVFLTPRFIRDHSKIIPPLAVTAIGSS